MVQLNSSRLELLFWVQLDRQLQQDCEREYLFAPPRKWRFDFAWPERAIAVEIEGGTWVQGRHNRGAEFERDAEKYAEATIAGWRVLRFTTDMVEDGRALEFTRRALS